MSKNFLFGHRKWNTLAFRGRLMSLLAPARGMAALPAKDGFSRPSFIRTPGSHLGLISPRTRKASAAIHRTQKKRFSFSRSLAYSICWDRLSLSFTASFFTPSHFHKRFNLFIIRSTASLIGAEGGDSWDWDCALLVPSKTIAITRPTENICGNSKRSSVGRTIVQSHEPCDPGVRHGDGRLSSRRPGTVVTRPTEMICRNAFMTNILLARGSPCPRQSRHCESGLLEQMSTLYCYKVKASACSGNQQFKLISKEYGITYKYIFCARKASRIFH